MLLSASKECRMLRVLDSLRTTHRPQPQLTPQLLVNACLFHFLYRLIRDFFLHCVYCIFVLIGVLIFRSGQLMLFQPNISRILPGSVPCPGTIPHLVPRPACSSTLHDPGVPHGPCPAHASLPPSVLHGVQPDGLPGCDRWTAGRLRSPEVRG